MTTIQDYCTQHNINSAYVTAIGACDELQLAWYDVHNKKYEIQVIKEDLEIAGMIGNIALVKGKVFLHAHGTFSDHHLKPVAGHIMKLVVSATCEVRLEVFEGKIEREYDEVTGLNLLTCKGE